MARVLKFERYVAGPGQPSVDPCLLYCIVEEGCEESGPCKIGIAKDIRSRLSSLQGGNWRKLVIVWTVHIPERVDAAMVESQALGRYRPSVYCEDDRKRLASEWVEQRPAVILKWAAGLLGDVFGSCGKIA